MSTFLPRLLCRFSLSVTSVFLAFIVLFFNDTATTEIYTLSLHDALPICKHYRVSEDDVFVVEKLTGEAGATVEFNDVLMIGEIGRAHV